MKFMSDMVESRNNKMSVCSTVVTKTKPKSKTVKWEDVTVDMQELCPDGS